MVTQSIDCVNVKFRTPTAQLNSATKRGWLAPAGPLALALLCSTSLAQSITLFDRITPINGPANALVAGRVPVTVNNAYDVGYVSTIEFTTPGQGGSLSELRIAYAGLPNSQPHQWTLRFMIWSSFSAASAGLPYSTTAMQTGDIATVNVPGTQAAFAPFGTHSFGGPIHEARIDLSRFNIQLASNTTYVFGAAVFNAGDCGIMETSQAGTPDRGLSNHYSGTGWRWMNSFAELDTGRYAVSLRMLPACTAPAVTTQPQPASGCLSGAATFSIAAAGTALAYQWQVQDGATWRAVAEGEDIVLGGDLIGRSSGSTTRQFTLSNTPISHNQCRVRCIVTNACGTVTSNPATLTICPGDFNCDGGVDGEDVGAFFREWESGNAAADVNADGGVDGADVSAFFEHWEAGC